MPDEYYHNGKLRPIEYHFDTYNYEEARIYKNNDNDSGWYFEYDYDSIIIDKSIIKTAHKEQTENSEAFDFLEKISDLEKLFRLLDIPKEKIHIFRDKIQKQYFDNRSKFFCIDKHYSVGGFYTQKGDDRNEGKSSFNQDSKWVERIIALQEGIEDKIRAKYNIPASKWISEQKLFEKIKSVFKNEKVIKHGRPKWLNRQHLDIYLPERDIGIEYQGDQHFRPIDFFGGEEAYKETVKRDKRKKRLCAKNNCNLIYVLPEDNFDEVVDKVKTLLIKE